MLNFTQYLNCAFDNDYNFRVAEEFVQLYLTPMENMTCEPLCQNGRCILPNLCACNSGWTGLDCSVGMNTCPC